MRGKLMNKSRTKGLTISEFKKNLYLLDEFPADMEVSKFIELYEKWLDALPEEDYLKVLNKIHLTEKDN